MHIEAELTEISEIELPGVTNDTDYYDFRG